MTKPLSEQLADFGLVQGWSGTERQPLFWGQTQIGAFNYLEVLCLLRLLRSIHDAGEAI